MTDALEGGLWFEDMEVGYRETSAEFVADRDEMIAYAKENDPWPIHTDPVAAAEAGFGDVIASFGYTVSLFLRAAHAFEINKRVAPDAFLSALGWSVAFKGPVRAGDRLHVDLTIQETRLTSRGDRGIEVDHFEIINQDGAPVVAIDVTSLVACRPH
jgi:acyl dehydratase